MKPQNERLFIDCLSEIHQQFGQGAEHRPQADFDRAERTLREGLKAGRVKSFLISEDFDRTPIPQERWAVEKFWDAAHTHPYPWKGSHWTIVLDAESLASIDTPTIGGHWIDRAPDEIKGLEIYRYLQIISRYLPHVRSKQDFQKKRMTELMIKNKVEGWPDLTKRDKDVRFFVLAKPRSKKRGKPKSKKLSK